MDNSLAESISEVQLAGWKLLSTYLNGGLGNSWFLYPVYLGISRDLQNQAKTLQDRWARLSKIQGTKNPLEHLNSTTEVDSIIRVHYENIKIYLTQLESGLVKNVPQLECDFLAASKPVSSLVACLKRVRPFILSYWIHGSVGNGDEKKCWSDLDGLVVVSENAFASNSNLQLLRRELICARKYLTDYMPYQLHGHFVVAEPDLVSLPTSVFPQVLFNFAACAVASIDKLKIHGRDVCSHTFEMLWEHGLKDLLNAKSFQRSDTTRKIAFLHRVYLLPCLIAQYEGKPVFKKEAFQQLDKYFTESELESLNLAQQVWLRWKAPSNWIRLLSRLSFVLRFNPLLYQKGSLYIGKFLPWFSGQDEIDWEAIRIAVKNAAESVESRLKRD